jgi:four helix bundle protein
MSRDYRKIVAWQRGHALTLAVYQFTKNFPSEERFALVNQLRRAAYGVPSNVAEGAGRETKRDCLRFLYNARGSLAETEYFLLLDLGYLPESDYVRLSEFVNAAFAALHGLIKAVEKEAGIIGKSWALLLSLCARAGASLTV